MSNSHQNLHPKRMKPSHKKLTAKKKMKRRQNQSLQKLYNKIRKSTDSNVSMNNTVVDNAANESMGKSKMDIHELTDGRSILFIEDRTGDNSANLTVLNKSSSSERCQSTPKGQKLYNKTRNSTHSNVSMNNTVVDNAANESMDKSKMDIHELTAGRSILFIEDRTGDNSANLTVLNKSSSSERCQSTPKGKHKKKSIPLAIKKSDTITLSDEDERNPRTLSPSRNTRPTSVFSSTPIANKSNNLNFSKISAVSKVSNSSISRQIRKIDNLTQEISGEEFVTIDLTHGTRSKAVIDLTRSRNDSVIDLEEGECSVSSMTLSDSDITVVNADEWKSKKDRLNEKDIAAGIAQMNASEKGRLLQLITNNIFNGCKTPTRRIPPSKKNSPEDTYIRDMLEGSIRDSIGGNVYNPVRSRVKTGLRMVIIDGSNVAMHHGMQRIFSVKGLKICIDYFLKRGHTVKAFVPQYRCQTGKSSDPCLLRYLESRGLVALTPSRKLDDGRCISSYDDRFIVQCAAEFDGVIVSQDRYRDLVDENPGWRQTIDKRLLQFTWVQDMIMFPLDPLGKNGPSLDQFLRHPDPSL